MKPRWQVRKFFNSWCVVDRSSYKDHYPNGWSFNVIGYYRSWPDALAAANRLAGWKR